LSKLKLKLTPDLSGNSCPICGSKDSLSFFEMIGVPTLCNIPWTSQEAAKRCSRGDIKLAFCPSCSYIRNTAFDPNRIEYSQMFENSLEYSPRFQTYERSLAKQLIKRYELHQKKIIEIGCGNGKFLMMLCKLGKNKGVGFDPAFVEKEEHRKMKNQVMFFQDVYSEKYAAYVGDLIVSRQTLEHINNPKVLLNMLRKTLGNHLNVPIVFEVPNAIQIFRNLFIWDIIYEHYSYFTSPSLSQTFSLSKFYVCTLDENFVKQFLCIHALPSDQPPAPSKHEYSAEVDRIANLIKSFAANYNHKIETWTRKLDRMEAKGQRAIIWGAGSKGVTFLNTLQESNIEYAVDISPLKNRKYIAGTGQQIVLPQFLHNYKPDVIIVMNPVYGREIRQLTKKLGVHAKLMYA
jgi:SAM-dependent methyltransferase